MKIQMKLENAIYQTYLSIDWVKTAVTMHL